MVFSGTIILIHSLKEKLSSNSMCCEIEPAVTFQSFVIIVYKLVFCTLICFMVRFTELHVMNSNMKLPLVIMGVAGAGKTSDRTIRCSKGCHGGAGMVSRKQEGGQS